MTSKNIISIQSQEGDQAPVSLSNIPDEILENPKFKELLGKDKQGNVCFNLGPLLALLGSNPSPGSKPKMNARLSSLSLMAREDTFVMRNTDEEGNVDVNNLANGMASTRKENKIIIRVLVGVCVLTIVIL